MKQETSTTKISTEVLEKVRRHVVNTRQTITEFLDLAALHVLSTKEVTHYRSAKTGKYVKKKTALKHPNTTVKEIDKN